VARSGGWVWLLLPIYGGYRALTDGVGRACVSDLLPSSLLGTGLGFYQGIGGGCALVAGATGALLAVALLTFGRRLDQGSGPETKRS